MWKYQCKKHLAFLLGGAVLGAIFFGFFGYGTAYLKEVAGILDTKEAYEMIKIPYIPYLIGAVLGAGASNGLMMTTYIMQRFNLSFIFMYVIIFVAFTPMAGIGLVLLVPAVIVCIYGWLTIPNRSRRNDLKKNAVSSVAEVERVYRLHHTYLSEYEDLAKKVWDYTLRMNLAYVIGLLCIFLLILWIEDFFMLLLVFIFYAILFFQLTRRKAIAVQPIISLLYDECNPEACASAIFALARKGKKRKNFPLAQYLAQSMIYMNDPHLAADVMVTCERNKSAMIFPYYSIMAYVYYQLGDRSMVKFQYDECEKGSTRMKSGPMSMLRQQCLSGIDNKLNMMDKDFDKAKAYYESLLETSGFEFQKVDAHYYLGLMYFVGRDLDDAQRHFNYVEEHGNKLYFVEKAKKFLTMIEAAQAKEAAAYASFE